MADDVSSDLAEFLEQHHRALDDFVKGNPEPLKGLYSQRDDVTLGNPFGPFVRGFDDVVKTMERAAENYRDGRAVEFETVARRVAGDLAYVVEVERYESKVGGRDDVTALSLRCTSVFTRESSGWKVQHRHADPITTARGPESVIQK